MIKATKKSGTRVIPSKDISKRKVIGRISKEVIMPNPKVFQGVDSATKEIPPIVFGNNITANRIKMIKEREKTGPINLKILGAFGS